jgi:hypothetical protein
LKIFYFVSGHGFGHISRSFEIIKEFLRNDIQIFLFTNRIDFLKNFNHSNLVLISTITDIGMIQNSSIDMDIMATKFAIIDFESNRNNLTEFLVSKIELHKPDFIISDSSSFPFYLAKSHKIPSSFIGNFTWDFIYQNYSKIDPFFEEYSYKLKLEYGLCDRGFELPFSCPITSVPNIKKIGLVGRMPTQTKESARRLLNFNDNYQYLLLSFGAYGLDSSKFNFENLDESTYLVVSGLKNFNGKNVIHLNDIYYPDLLIACDAVLTKPGYGILSEAYNTNCPIIYTDRGDFIEYKYLLDAMNEYHNSVFITQEELFELNLSDKLKFIKKNSHKKKKKLESGVQEIVKTFLI